jgi:hypothetical protein
MASAFESFVQVELPLRPYVAVDGEQESIAIRRGAGPRQTQFVALQEGQILAKVNGVLVGVTPAGGVGGGVRHMVLDVPELSPLDTWTLEHNMNSRNLLCEVFVLQDDGSLLRESCGMKIVDADTVELGFSYAVSGKAILSFVD